MIAKRIQSALVVGLAIAAAMMVHRPSSSALAVSDDRIARLARGINLPNWFWLGPDDPDAIRNRVSDEELTRLREMGFTNVRIPVAMAPFYNPDAPAVPNADMLALLDSQIDRILAADLAVIIDLHTVNVDEGATVYSGDLETDDAFVENFLAFWGGFASHLKKYDPDLLFLEVFNEPVFLNNQSRWVEDILPRTLAAVRVAAPDHTLIASGTRWSSIDGLLLVTPVDDPNIVYNFHFYEPFIFTHQGASWVDDPVIKSLFGVPYPSDPEKVVTPLFDRYSPEGQTYLRGYGEERWNIEKLDAWISKAVAWAEEHGVQLICTEFGAYAPLAPKNSRIQWISDVRTTFEKYGIAWVMWEYDGSFGFVERVAGELKYNEDVITALGLQP
ncbi:MAG: glycoside hydrolase family 5 protein [Anaerolineae bacterium]|nr:MAG: glycoside hydrolase family 5 protein [Anaerolineae bacterium]